MKKILAFVLVLLMLAACAVAEDAQPVMTHAEYVAADLESEVTIETYVQDKQGWWNDQAMPISCTICPSARKTMISWFPAPRSA